MKRSPPTRSARLSPAACCTRAAATILIVRAALWIAPLAVNPAVAGSESAAASAASAPTSAARDAALPSTPSARLADVASAIRVEQAWIRWLPAGLPAGGYVTLTNRSDHAIVLVGAASPDYRQVQLHRSVVQGGLSKMVPVAAISISAHSTLDFVALGYHLMLMNPRVALSPGDHVPIELRFADGRSLVATFDLRPPSAVSSGTKHSGETDNMPGMSGMPGMSNMQSTPHVQQSTAATPH